ncbi:hypothetical protein BO86DRAFT_224555 [Aspergillus japonicus CBS 114.51]|uniref:Uncharacterized protein n=1 Tax=Aspergillus japonicus CBS 114.51 TaxID=1448312 RepID=A0A8T8WNQ8_ASPJA|nr:hypothetical protein BO86DRAFT_224555 [Aspergillus japonicus CBS 114.51]RAH77323.1 hypothetical protein BO86DRAFT_224555 [Aspergillus japonicus CBS 114.51]
MVFQIHHYSSVPIFLSYIQCYIMCFAKVRAVAAKSIKHNREMLTRAPESYQIELHAQGLTEEDKEKGKIGQ